MKNLKTFLDRFKSRVEGLKATDNASQDQDEVEEIEQLLKNIEDQIEDIDTEMEDDEELSSQKPLIDKLSEHKNDFNILKNKFNQKKDEIKSAHAKELLFTGQLKGIDKRKAERDVAADQVKEVDEQGQMLDSIHENVKGANVNLENMNVEAKKQGEQIDRIGDKVITMDNTVKKTGNVMTDIERRICCRKCIIVSGIILIFLMNIIMAFLILAKVFGWHPLFKTDNRIKGVSLSDYTKEIKYDKFSGESISFVMLKAGSGETKESKVESNYNDAKNKNIDVGMFWVIDATSLDGVPAQINKAKDFIKTEIKGKKDIKYKFYFKINTPNAFDHLTDINNFCDTDLSGYCGLSVGVSTFNSKLKDHMGSLDKITHIWIDSYDKDFDIKVNEKILIHNLNEEVTLGSTFTIIEAKKS